MEQRQAWFKFCPQDWQGDMQLRSCSPLARCFWIECLCIMHFADPRGHLLVNGQVPSDRQLATMAGLTVREVRTARDELVRSGAASLEGDVLFSRRMIRDTARSKQASDWGRGGGNPSLKAPDKPDLPNKDKANHKQTRDRVPEARDPEIQKDPTTKKERPIFDAGTVVVFPWMEAHYQQLLTQTKREAFDLFAWYQQVADDLQARAVVLPVDQRHRYLTERLIRDASLPKPSLTRTAEAAPDVGLRDVASDAAIWAKIRGEA